MMTYTVHDPPLSVSETDNIEKIFVIVILVMDKVMANPNKSNHWNRT